MGNYAMWSTQVKLQSLNRECVEGEKVTFYRKLRYIENILYRDSTVVKTSAQIELKEIYSDCEFLKADNIIFALRFRF